MQPGAAHIRTALAQRIMRINELARELEVKARAIIEYLGALYPEEKLSHSSAIDDGMARKVKTHFASGSAKDASALGGGKAAQPAVVVVKTAAPATEQPKDAPAAPPAPAAAAPAPLRKPVVAEPVAAAPQAAPAAPAAPMAGEIGRAHV